MTAGIVVAALVVATAVVVGGVFWSRSFHKLASGTGCGSVGSDACPISTRTATATPTGRATFGGPTAGPMATAYDALGAGLAGYFVAAVPTPDRAIVYGTSPDAGDNGQLLPAGHKSAEIAEVSLKDGSAVWKLGAAGLCPGHSVVNIEAADADSQGRTVVALAGYSHYVADGGTCVVTLGLDGKVQSRRTDQGGVTYEGTAGTTAVVADTAKSPGSVTGYSTTVLSKAVWSAPVSAGMAGDDAAMVVRKDGIAAYAWADGGYRDMATGQPAGFGAGLAVDGDDEFRFWDGQLFKVHTPSDSTDATIQAWRQGADQATWPAPVSVDQSDPRVAVAGGFALVKDGEDSDDLIAYGLATGTKAWQLEEPLGTAVDAVAVAGSDFVLVKDNGTVTWLDAATGKTVATVDGLAVPNDVSVLPTGAAAGGVMVPTQFGLWAVSPADGGTTEWTLPLALPLADSTIVKIGGAFYLGAPPESTDEQIQDWSVTGSFEAIAKLNF
ncbi:MAG: PQQ-like beta-propeller repeat protein [Bifidobacteriaceae bacterium]|nr:PQQ-like beta-propeller repeat protein [Bifidobacteriaceae bacterium]